MRQFVVVCLQTHDPLAMLKSKGYLGGVVHKMKQRKGQAKHNVVKRSHKLKTGNVDGSRVVYISSVNKSTRFFT